MNVISSLVILLIRCTALASRVTRLRFSRQVSTTRRLWEFFAGDFSLIFFGGVGTGRKSQQKRKILKQTVSNENSILQNWSYPNKSKSSKLSLNKRFVIACLNSPKVLC